jgi:aminoglycoside/choline kinase family phosphotransferase
VQPAPDALAWARDAVPELGAASVEALPAAGSPRRLTRLRHRAGSVVLVENPCPLDGTNENDSFVYLAGHLRAKGLPVPEVHAYNRELGCYLVEDLGDHDLFAETRVFLTPGAAVLRDLPGRLPELYREAVSTLVGFQVDGREGFDPKRVHNPPRYDRALMLTGESGYFVREFLGNHLGREADGRLLGELEALADRAAEAGAPYLLHRDYQSQNLKVSQGRLFVIDFQGARLGPPQYDIAALLYDPYAFLPRRAREALLALYLDLLVGRTGEDRGRFLELFPYIGAHRLMQALGAYAFLGLRRGKPAFLAHVPAALELLGELLRTLPAAEVRELARAVAAARERTGDTPLPRRESSGAP